MKIVCKIYVLGTVVLIIMFSVISVATASEKLLNRWTFYFGALSANSIDTTVSAIPKNVAIPIGSIINLNRDLNVSNRDQSFRIGAGYRFTDRHQINFSYYKMAVSGEKIIQNDFSWNGQDYKAGMKIGSSFETTTTKLGYLYNFHNDNKVELSVGGGLHISNFAVGMSLLGEVQGSPVPVDFNEVSELNATAPFPFISAMIKYNITKRWLFSWEYDVLRMSYSGIEGVMIDSLISIEHNTFKHVGFGLGFDQFRIDISGQDSDINYEYSNDYDVLIFYVKGQF